MTDSVACPKSVARRITARKWQGDDAGSWAVFIDGRMFVCGLNRSEVPYYKREAAKRFAPKQGDLR
jgi:hypothetical protein